MSRELKIATVQIAKRALAGISFLDVTVKSGDPAFAPSWALVNGYKDGTFDEESYTDLYRTRMILSSQTNYERWIQVVNMGEVTLGCYCKAGDFCHRLLLAEYLRKAAESKGYRVEYVGELL